MKRKLASIQTILDLQPIEGADRIELAAVLGWKCVVDKHQFNVGDKCIYFEIDSLIPAAPWNDRFRKEAPDKPLRIKTRRFRNTISQGLCFDLSILPKQEYTVGDDVTEILGVEKYEPTIPAELAGQIKGNFPTAYISKTDEIRLQSVPDVLQECIDRKLEMVGTLKCDGSSMTTGFIPYPNEVGCVVNDFIVCSRNLNLKENEGNSFWKIARKYDIESKLGKELQRFVIQGELIGPGIQKNRMGLTELDLRVFNVKNIDSQTFLNRVEMEDLCKKYGLTPVPIVARKVFTQEDTLQSLLDFSSKLMYDSGHPAEGIVWRSAEETTSEVLKGRMSFKVISNEYLIKCKE